MLYQIARHDTASNLMQLNAVYLLEDKDRVRARLYQNRAIAHRGLGFAPLRLHDC